MPRRTIVGIGHGTFTPPTFGGGGGGEGAGGSIGAYAAPILGRRDNSWYEANRPVPPAPTRTFYCDAAAAAGGDGSQATPWNSLATVNSNVAAGDLVYLKGTFPDGQYLRPPLGTSAAAWAQYVLWPGAASCTIYGDQPGGLPPCWVTGRQYCYFDGLTFDSRNASGAAGSPSITPQGGAGHLYIANPAGGKNRAAWCLFVRGGGQATQEYTLAEFQAAVGAGPADGLVAADTDPLFQSEDEADVATTVLVPQAASPAKDIGRNIAGLTDAGAAPDAGFYEVG